MKKLSKKSQAKIKKVAEALKAAGYEMCELSEAELDFIRDQYESSRVESHPVNSIFALVQAFEKASK